jgi:UDP-N-acetylmuramate dehydrogenase
VRRGTGVGAVEAAAAVLGPGAVRDWPLGRHTTYRVGGPAALYYEAHGPEDLERVAAALAASELPLLVVGRGSNLLVADAGFPGLVVGLGAGFGEVRREGVSVRAGRRSHARPPRRAFRVSSGRSACRGPSEGRSG